MTGYLSYKNDFSDPNFASVIDELSFWSARFGLLLFNNLEIHPNQKILDLGCGNGFPLFELAHVHGPSCRVVGLDPWKEALQRANLKLKFYDLPNVSLVEADGAAMPFPDGEFDLIVCNLGINNFHDPSAVLGECFRVAKPGARLALTTNCKGHLQEFYSVFREVLQGAGKADYLDRLTANENHRGTCDSICALLQNAGFNIADIIEAEALMRYADGTAFFNHSLTKIGFLDGWRAVVNPADEQATFSVLEQKLNDLAAKQGDLTMTVPMLYIEAVKPAQTAVVNTSL